MSSTRKPRVFVSSVFVGLEDERKALDKLLKAYHHKVDVWGYPWTAGADPSAESRRRARESDFMILVLAGRYGSKDPLTNVGITQSEYEEFLYTHTVEYCTATDLLPLYIFAKDPAAISPEHADLPHESDDLLQFYERVKKRHVLPPAFQDWRELQQAVTDVLDRIPHTVPDKEYQKLSIRQFDFKILGGLGKYRESQVDAAWSPCPCSIHHAGACDFKEEREFRPPKLLRSRMKRYLKDLEVNPKTDPRWLVDRPSFKTISIRESTDVNDVAFAFCNSTWLQFLGTNQAATKDASIHDLLDSVGSGVDISTSPFSNNLGLAIAVIDSVNDTLFHDPQER